MKKILKLLFGLVFVVSLTSCVERVDAGHEGILVNLYGNDKGVDDVSLVTGWVWYAPWSKQVFEYPTYAQTIDYPAFEVNSKDGTKFTVDPSVILHIANGKAPIVFKKYRTGLDTIINKTLFVYIKDAARIEFNKYTADSIVSCRESVDKSFEDRVRLTLAKENFVLEQLTPGIKYPKSYEEAINAKNKAIQDQMRVANEVKVAEANARKIIVQAQAEAESNRLKQQALTPQILEKMWIEKWDGKLPVYGQVPTIFKDISK